MQRRRQPGTIQPRLHAIAIDHRHGELRLKAHVIAGADIAEERQRFAITAHQNVLAVVHQLAGLPIAKRGRAAAQPVPCFDHLHARAAARQPDRRAQSGETRANDDDVVTALAHDGNNHSRSAIAACTGLGTRVGFEKTS